MNPVMTADPINVTGMVRNPRLISSEYALSSSSTFRTMKLRRARERNSFTLSQARQCEPEYTMMSVAIRSLYAFGEHESGPAAA